MNLYSRKYWYKILLLTAALTIVGLSLYFSNRMVDDVRKDERLRIKVWSEAIKNTANQLYVTNKLFDKLRNEERKKMKIWARAIEELGSDHGNYLFALEIVQFNTTIPVILTDKDGIPSSAQNIGFTLDSIKVRLKKMRPDQDDIFYKLESKRIWQDTLTKMYSQWKETHPPIIIAEKKEPVNYVYFIDSKIIDDLQKKKDSLSHAFHSELVKNTALVPVIFTDATQTEVIETNMDSMEVFMPGKLSSLLEDMRAQNEPIHIKLNSTESGYIFYYESAVLQQLRWFPYIQLIIVTVFLLVAYLIFSTFRKAEQNQVWVGMAKETAHQLGTPLSSLMAWMEILKDSGVPESTLIELNKDVDRLKIITERFSKIGADAKLQLTEVGPAVEHVLSYLRPRISKKVSLEVLDEEKLKSMINGPLFEWVIENIVKNAVDAMEGEGNISFHIHKKGKRILLDITDTGKGIAPGKFKTIFQPGFTTKQRGWGLGLTLVKRIVENYHHGRIYVWRSEVDKGTSFRIELRRK